MPEKTIEQIDARVDHLETSIFEKLNSIDKHISDLSQKMELQKYGYEADTKINDFKIEALQRLFKRQEELGEEIADIKKELAEYRGAQKLLKWLMGLIGFGGLAAFIKSQI